MQATHTPKEVAFSNMLALLKEVLTVFDNKQLLDIFAIAALHGFKYSGPHVDMEKVRGVIAQAERAAKTEDGL